MSRWRSVNCACALNVMPFVLFSTVTSERVEKLFAQMRQREVVHLVDAVIVPWHLRTSAARCPAFARFAQWMRAKLFASTALMPRYSGTSAACSRDEPLAVVLPADDDAPCRIPSRAPGSPCRTR